MIIGVCGRWRISQLLQHWLILPEDKTAVPLDYLVMTFVPAVQQLLSKHSEVMKNDESGTGIMIGYRGTLYHMDSAFNINSFHAPILNDGSGGAMAQGAFRALLDSGVPVEDAMLKALAIAGDYDLTVAAPYYVERL